MEISFISGFNVALVIRDNNSSIIFTSQIDKITPLLIQEFERESDKYKAPA